MNLRNATAIAIVLPFFGMAAAPANAADINDPMIEDQIAKEASKWSLYGALLGGFSASQSEFDLDDDTTVGPIGDDTASFDGIGGDAYVAAVRLGLEKQYYRWVVGVIAEGGLFGDSENGFSFSDGNGDSGADGEFSADWYWLTAGKVGYAVATNTIVYGLAGYGEIETGDITFQAATDDDLNDGKANDPDLGGLVLGAGIEARLNERMRLFVEGRKWHNISGDTTIPECDECGDDISTDMETDIWQGLVGLRVNLN